MSASSCEEAEVYPDSFAVWLKVCAYCRVSTEEDAQLSSYGLQVQYYQEYINSYLDWELVDIYAGEGITGTSTKKCESFKRMIRDCEVGKIDYIVTKSISRFARNVLDCLIYVRKLKNLPRRVGVYFEKADAFTKTPNGERIYRWRKQTIERSFAEAKELHGLRYARMLGLAGMYEQSFLTAAVQNMKRIANAFPPLFASVFLFLNMFKGHDFTGKSCPLAMV